MENEHDKPDSKNNNIKYNEFKHFISNKAACI